MSLIKVSNLSRDFRVPVQSGKGLARIARSLFKPEHRIVRALQGVTFNVEEGEFIGYIGGNGAGKSTTMKLLTGILSPTAGSVHVNGMIPHRDRLSYTRGIGVVFGKRSLLLWDLPIRDSFALYRSIYRLPVEFDSYTDFLIDHFGMRKHLDTPARKLSLGETMRADLIAALMHQPRILFLDEPTIGLDFTAKEQFRALLLTIHSEQGMAIMLTSHDLAEIEALASRVIVLREGRVSYDGTIRTLREGAAHGKLLDVEFRRVLKPDAFKATLAHHKPVKHGNHFVKFQVPHAQARALIANLMDQLDVTDIRVEDLPLEQLVRQHYAA